MHYNTCQKPVNMSTYVALKKRPYARKEVKTQPRKLPMVLYKAPRGQSLTNPKTGSSSPELKNIDTGGSVGQIPNGFWSELDLLNPIQVGADSNQRVGRKVQLKSLLFRWNESTATALSPIRILIVYDKEPNQATPVLTEVITSDNYNAPMNLSNSNRFIVLADELHPVIFSSGSAGTYRVGKIFKKLNLPMMFTASSIDVTSVTCGAIFAMIACPTPGNPIPPGPVRGIGYIARVRYTDV